MIRVLRVGLFVASFLLATAAFSQTVVVTQAADAATLDPGFSRELATYNVLWHIYDPLILKQGDGSFVPALAESWEAVDDLTWHFTLRDGAKFHNGEAVTSYAVKYSVSRILDPENASPIRSGFAFIKDVEVLSDREFLVHTHTPQPLAQVTFSELFVVPPVHVAAVGAEEFGTHPVGSGPYRFVSWQRGVEIVLEANPDYWGEPAPAERLIFRPSEDAFSRASSLSAGETDLIVGVPSSLQPLVAGNRDVALKSVESTRVIYIGINTLKGGALADPRVAQALNYAVDVDAIIAGVLGGAGAPTTTLLTGIDFGYTSGVERFRYDPERAKALLAEAGASDLSITLGTPNGRYVNDVQVAQAVAAQLQDVGITVDVAVQEYGAYVGALFSGNAPDLYLIGWGNPALDADYILWPLTGTGQLLSYYSDARLDELLTTGRSTIDRDTRAAAYAEAMQILTDAPAAIYLYKPVDTYGVSARLSAWEPRGDELIRVHGFALQ
ncbi:MAG: ABC transporter substrate-binding protein [Trueperaceae bacterium]|nr:ABC transporter substrate-binding protein [Trueperaceae bacterium]